LENSRFTVGEGVKLPAALLGIASRKSIGDENVFFPSSLRSSP